MYEFACTPYSASILFNLESTLMHEKKGLGQKASGMDLLECHVLSGRILVILFTLHTLDTPATSMKCEAWAINRQRLKL